MNAFQVTFSAVVPPANYSVVRVSFQVWQAVSPTNKVVSTHTKAATAQHYYGVNV